MFKAITGMSSQQFDSLYAEVARLYGEAEFARLNNKSRKRGVGAGSPLTFGKGCSCSYSIIGRMRSRFLWGWPLAWAR